jgi:hypothetical protein
VEFVCRPTGDSLNLGQRNTAIFLDFVKKNPNVPWRLAPVLPESGKQRRFYHGAIIPLWAFLDGKDYKDKQVLADLHEVAKLEFNGELITVGGVVRKVGRSTVGKLNEGFLERVISYLEENYAIDPGQCLNPTEYKKFVNEIYMHGKYDTYIDYLVALGRLSTRV